MLREIVVEASGPSTNGCFWKSWMPASIAARNAVPTRALSAPSMSAACVADSAGCKKRQIAGRVPHLGISAMVPTGVLWPPVVVLADEHVNRGVSDLARVIGLADHGHDARAVGVELIDIGTGVAQPNPTSLPNAASTTGTSIPSRSQILVRKSIPISCSVVAGTPDLCSQYLRFTISEPDRKHIEGRSAPRWTFAMAAPA